jgi:hypothetical protein
MAKKFNLDFSKGRKSEYIITKNQLIYTFLAIISIFCLAKIYNYASLSKQTLDYKLASIASGFKDSNNLEKFNQVIVTDPFCGYKIEDASNATLFSSPDFSKTSQNGSLISKKITINNAPAMLSICTTLINKIDSSANRQAIIVVILAAIIIFLVNDKTIFVKNENENNNEEKISNS